MTETQILISGTLGMLMLLVSIVVFIYVYQRKMLKKNMENQSIKDMLKEEEIRSAYALLEGQDKERKRIASELHDNLGSILTSLNMFADALQNKSDENQIKEVAKKISETADLANVEVRKLSHRLDSGLLKHFGLKVAISQLLEAIESSTKIEVQYEIDFNQELENNVSIEIYRIIQELLNNALKHSSCSKIRLDISAINGEMNLIFNDNGIGFIPDKIKRGMGLSNIEKRLEKIGGHLSIESSPNTGSTFIIEMN